MLILLQKVLIFAETTVYDGQVTPKGTADGTTELKVITEGTAGDGEILIVQPTTPGRLH